MVRSSPLAPAADFMVTEFMFTVCVSAGCLGWVPKRGGVPLYLILTPADMSEDLLY